MNVEAAEPTLEDRIEVQPIGEEQIMREEQIGGQINELNSLWAELEAMKLVEGGLNDYLAVDDQLATGGTRTLAEIVADVSKADAEDDTEVLEVEEEPVTTDATSALKILQRYVDENTRDLAVLHTTGTTYDSVHRLRATYDSVHRLGITYDSAYRLGITYDSVHRFTTTYDSVQRVSTTYSSVQLKTRYIDSL